MWSSSKGTMLWPANLRNSWRRAVAGTAVADTSPHVLRRTFGERVRLAHGIDAAQKALGHSSRATTEEHYTRDEVKPLRVDIETPGLLPAADNELTADPDDLVEFDD